jgi:hypothetical protein
MSKNTHAQTKRAHIPAKDLLASITPDKWGNNPLELADKWSRLLVTFEGAPLTKRESIARELVYNEIVRLNELAGVK